MGWLARLFRRRPTAKPVAATRARAPVSEIERDRAATLIDALKDQAAEDAVEIDGGAIDRIAAKVVRHGYRAMPEVAAFPVSAERIVEVSKRDDGDLNPLVHAISHDAAVTASVIAAANSAASAPESQITTPRDAVLRLGAAEASRVALAVAMRGMFRGKNGAVDAGLRTQFFIDSLADAFTTVRLANMLRLAGAEHAFVITMVRELARPVALSLLENELPTEAARLGQPETVAVVDAAAPMVMRAVIESLKLPEGLGVALDPASAGAESLLHMTRLVSAIGAMQRRAPRPAWWAAQAHGAALYLELPYATVRAAITQREEDGMAASRIASAA